jgi:hypothetical protein
MLKLVAKGPEEPGSKDARDESDAQNRRPARPLSAVPDLFDPGVGETPTGKE